MAADVAHSGRVIASLLTGDAVLRIAPVLVAVVALSAAGFALWLRASRRRVAAALEQEQARHAALRRRVDALEAMDLTARRLAATAQHAQIADHAVRAAEELLGAGEVVLRIQVAEDLAVMVRGTIGDDTDAPPAAGTADAELAVQELADLAWSRRALVRGDDPHGAVTHRMASPLRHGDGMVGVLVLGRPAADGPFGAADTSLVERLTAHVALAVVRSGAHVAASRSSGKRDTATRADARDASPPLPPPSEPLGSSCDLVAVVREVTVHARAAAEDQGQPRRLAVLAPQRAVAQLPEHAVRELVRETYELVIGATEPGTNLAVELLAQEDSWELVVAHSGEAIPTPVLEASPAAAAVRQLGGEVESGQGAGVARIRILLLGSRVSEPAGTPAVPVAFA